MRDRCGQVICNWEFYEVSYDAGSLRMATTLPQVLPYTDSKIRQRTAKNFLDVDASVSLPRECKQFIVARQFIGRVPNNPQHRTRLRTKGRRNCGGMWQTEDRNAFPIRKETNVHNTTRQVRDFVSCVHKNLGISGILSYLANFSENTKKQINADSFSKGGWCSTGWDWHPLRLLSSIFVAVRETRECSATTALLRSCETVRRNMHAVKNFNLLCCEFGDEPKDAAVIWQYYEPKSRQPTAENIRDQT